LALARVPRPKEPRSAEVGYISDLRRVWLEAQTIIAHGLQPLLDIWVTPERIDDDETDRAVASLRRWLKRKAIVEGRAIPRPSTFDTRSVTAQLAWIRATLVQWLDDNQGVNQVINRTATAVDRHARRDMARILRVDIAKDVPGLADFTDLFRARNIQLIESGVMAPFEAVRLRHQGLLGDVEEVVRQAQLRGTRVEVLARQLKERFGVSDSRAALIARDQVLTYNAQVTQTRARAVGIEEYIWSTSKDERVRDEHQEREGRKFRYDNPPSDGNPGEPVQCRCVGTPVVPLFAGIQGPPSGRAERARRGPRRLLNVDPSR